MQTTFTYGTRRSAISVPRLGAFDPTYEYQAYASYGRVPLMPSDAAALLSSKDIAAINTALAQSVQYESSVRAYYDHMLGTTNSPGKSDRIRANRRDVLEPVLTTIALLKSGVATLQANAVASSVSKQSDYNPNTGKASTPEEESSGGWKKQSSDSGMAKFIIPAAAGLAALFFLKGH